MELKIAMAPFGMVEGTPVLQTITFKLRYLGKREDEFVEPESKGGE